MGRLRDALAGRFRDRTAVDVSVEGTERTALELAEELAANPRTVRLRDGRGLGYAEVGDPDGDPLVLYHGFPSSRVFAALFDATARDEGVRVVAPDRPGFGVSDPDPERSLTDWPGDVRELLDALGIERASVLGISGGGPYAAVTAAMLDDRIDRVGIVCGLAPMESVGLRERLWYYTGRFAPPVTGFALWLLGLRGRLDPEGYLESWAEGTPPADADLWTGEVGRVLRLAGREARRHHGRGPLVQETGLYGSPWGFDLADIEVPVALWYGKADTIVPVEMGLYLAREIPSAEAHVYPDYGHLTVVEENETDVLRWLSAGR